MENRPPVIPEAIDIGTRIAQSFQRPDRSSSPSKFPKFAQFALELRQLIWEFVAAIPRVVEVGGRVTSRILVPALIHTCKEARSVGLFAYERIGYYSSFSAWNFGTRETYINWNVDIVLLKNGVEFIVPQEEPWKVILTKCSTLAVPWKNSSDLQSAMRYANIEFKLLRTLVVVYGYGQEAGNEDFLLCEGERLESERSGAKRAWKSEREHGGNRTNYSSLENVAYLDVRRDKTYIYDELRKLV